MFKSSFCKITTNQSVKMATDTTTFPEGDAEAELNPGQNNNFQVDPVSSEIAAEKVFDLNEFK